MSADQLHDLRVVVAVPLGLLWVLWLFAVVSMLAGNETAINAVIGITVALVPGTAAAALLLRRTPEANDER